MFLSSTLPYRTVAPPPPLTAINPLTQPPTARSAFPCGLYPAVSLCSKNIFYSTVNSPANAMLLILRTSFNPPAPLQYLPRALVHVLSCLICSPGALTRLVNTKVRDSRREGYQRHFGQDLLRALLRRRDGRAGERQAGLSLSSRLPPCKYIHINCLKATHARMCERPQPILGRRCILQQMG